MTKPFAYKPAPRTAVLFVASLGILVLGISAIASPQFAHGADDIRDIIKNVRSSEQLYKDIDVTLQEEYVDSRPPPGRQEGFLPTRQRTVTIQCVKQKGMSHLGVQGTVRRLTQKQEEETVARNKIRLFDGTTSRVVEGTRANIVAGPTLDSDMISPHMLVLQRCGYPVPLSTYMEGHLAMLAYRGMHWDPEIHIQTEYQGEVTVETHPCQKVAIKHIIGQKRYLHSAWVLWLAMDRNYIPIRCEGYTYSDSKTLPLGEAVSRDLREIAPGVWFPYEVVVTAYNSITLREHQRQELGWRDRYTVTSISLDPHYPIAFFRDLKIPDGTYVYEVDANEKIGHSYVEGAPSEPIARGSSNRWWSLWGSLLAMIACIIILIARRLRRVKLSN